MAGSNIDAVFAKIINDCQAVAVEAVENAAKKAQNDILKEANNYLELYYSRYSPTSYKRTYQLQKAITPVFENHSGKDGVSVEIGVEYDSSKLAGSYKSNSWYHQAGDFWISKLDSGFKYGSQNNGIPQPDWIMDNFLKGEHGGAQRDFDGTYTLMSEFIEKQLPERIDQYVQNELFSSIVSKL